MTNALTYTHNLARVVKAEDQAVELAFKLERERWPWLSLPPWHPILVEKFQYFSNMTACWELGTFAPETFTALTHCRWQCTDAAFAEQYPERARVENSTEGQGMSSKLSVYAPNDKLLYQCDCSGVAFADRDFQSWRQSSRQSCLDAPTIDLKPAVAPAIAGLPGNGKSFVSAIYQHADRDCVQALVTKSEGFFPAHPFHTGSGDHVNAAQLIDCALQAAHVFAGQAQAWTEPMICLAGEAQFKRYVELDVPFEIQLQAPIDSTVKLRFCQAGRNNVDIQLALTRAPQALEI